MLAVLFFVGPGTVPAKRHCLCALTAGTVPGPTQPFTVAADWPRDDLALGSIVQKAKPTELWPYPEGKGFYAGLKASHRLQAEYLLTQPWWSSFLGSSPVYASVFLGVNTANQLIFQHVTRSMVSTTCDVLLDQIVINSAYTVAEDWFYAISSWHLTLRIKPTCID